MTSILTAPPAAEPVSLAEAKAHLRLTHGDEDGTLLRLIAAARRLVEIRTGLALIRQGWSQFRDAWPDDGVALLRPGPAIAVEEVRVYGEDDVAAVIEPAHYVVDFASRPARLVLRGSRFWPRPGRPANGIEIRFLAGFGDAGADVPAELREAVLGLLAHAYANRGAEDAPPLPPLALGIIGRWKEMRL